MKTKNVLVGIALFILIAIYRESIANFLHTISDQQAVSAYLQSYGVLGPVVLFILMVAQVFVAVIPGHALMVTAGYVYGGLGLLVVILSTILGSQIAFFIARWYGRDLIYKLASPKIIERWDKAAKHQGALFYFFSFVLPIFPSDLMCYVAGLATISPRRFFVANIFGRTCVAVFVTLIGIYGMHPPVEFWIIAISGTSVFFAGWAVHKKAGALPRTKKEFANAFAILVFKTWRAIFGLKYEAKGFDSLPSGAKIIAINHTNASDVIFLPLVLSKMPRMIAQGDLFDIPVLGSILKETGQISVDPDSPKEAFDQACELLQRGETFVIFPEGRLVPYGQRVKAKTGAVRLSLTTGAPIIPLGIYTDLRNVTALQINKDGREREGLYQFKGTCHLCFGAALRPSPLQKKPSQVHAMTEELMDQIYSLVEQGRKESQSVRFHENFGASRLESFGNSKLR